jgi:hypothetical protein
MNPDHTDAASATDSTMWSPYPFCSDPAAGSRSEQPGNRRERIAQHQIRLIKRDGPLAVPLVWVSLRCIVSATSMTRYPPEERGQNGR